MMRNIVLLLFVLIDLSYAQENSILDRLQALEGEGKIWYNIDGYSVTSENFDYDFNEKGLKKVIKKYNIKNDSGTRLASITRNNLYFLRTEKIAGDLTQNNAIYVVEDTGGKIIVLWFAKTGEMDMETEQLVTNMIVDKAIPKENFVANTLDSINFGGRKIALGNSCYWTFLNTVNCPYFGSMNWSVHKTLQSAQTSIENQFTSTNARKSGKVVSDNLVDVIFEGVSTKARKVKYDFRGATRLLTGLSGGKSLTIYYVAEKVRGNYLSCVMSFWNDDQINPETQLPPLLEKVMELKL